MQIPGQITPKDALIDAAIRVAGKDMGNQPFDPVIGREEHAAQIGRDLVATSQPQIQLGGFAVESPADVIKLGTDIATQLGAIILDRKLYADIQGKKYVTVEGWTTCAAMLGFVAREVEVKEDDEGNVIAWVEIVRVSDGQRVGYASAICGVDEPKWSTAEVNADGKLVHGCFRYARRSMAVTRATSKACRLMFAWIVKLAGYQPTPAEEAT